MESPSDREEAGQQEAQRLAQGLETHLDPLLVWLDAVVDERLVRTCVEGSAASIRFRNRAQGLCLSELGSYLRDRKGMDWDVDARNARGAGSGNDAVVDKKRERSKYATRAREDTGLGSNEKMGKKSASSL